MAILHDSDEHIAIRHTVKRLVADRLPGYRDAPKPLSFPRPLFEEMASIGLAGLVVQEQYGGAGMGAVTSSIVMEELSKGDLGCAVFLSVHLMVSGLIQRSGNDAQKQRLLPRLSSGEALAAFALTEPTAGSNPAQMKCTYSAKDGSYVITGEKCYITSAGFADIYLLFARREGSSGSDGISAFIIEPSRLDGGWSISAPEAKMGAELSPIASISMDSIKVPPDALLGEIEAGYSIALGGLASGRVNIAACANGISSEAIRLAVAHLRDREQFGSKLIEMQGLQFMLADMQMKLISSQLVTRQAAELLELSPSDARSKILSSTAKCLASDAAMAITTDAVQLLGGAGYIHEYRVEQLMRDAKMLQIVEGTNQIQRLVIAREMQKLY
ncbi:MAG: acyl-CoA dehydrogenase family protein [Deltaproteobacteria bacterium]|nr:acyl-CoA dehydrogenase family protein [Deltaproteobacteria bacterium]